MGKQKPANDATNNVAGGERDIDVEGLSLRESCRLKENNGIPKDGVAAEDLSGPGQYNSMSRSAQFINTEFGEARIHNFSSS